MYQVLLFKSRRHLCKGSMILRKIPFVSKKHYSPGGLPVVAARGGQRICSKIQNGGAE